MLGFLVESLSPPLDPSPPPPPIDVAAVPCQLARPPPPPPLMLPAIGPNEFPSKMMLSPVELAVVELATLAFLGIGTVDWTGGTKCWVWFWFWNWGSECWSGSRDRDIRLWRRVVSGWPTSGRSGGGMTWGGGMDRRSRVVDQPGWWCGAERVGRKSTGARATTRGREVRPADRMLDVRARERKREPALGLDGDGGTGGE